MLNPFTIARRLKEAQNTAALTLRIILPVARTMLEGNEPSLNITRLAVRRAKLARMMPSLSSLSSMPPRGLSTTHKRRSAVSDPTDCARRRQP